MSASLVGSEMCIRDRPWRRFSLPAPRSFRTLGTPSPRPPPPPQAFRPVSYTHLTLPTICSV
eukprot:15222694-Alexandrium_andersonii.AAC.1